MKPDLVIHAETPLGAGPYYIEVERTAVHPERVAQKLAPYRRAHEAGRFAPVIFITEKPTAEELFRRQSQGLPVLTCTLADVRGGPLTGEDSVWRHWSGEAVSLKPAFPLPSRGKRRAVSKPGADLAAFDRGHRG